jgi:repressor LexA
MDEMTTKQGQVMAFITECMRKQGYPPTMREIGERFGVTFAAAKGHLQALHRKGYIRLHAGRSRGIEVIGPRMPEALSLPLAGDIRAGEPITALREYGEQIAVDRTLFPDEDSFALRVRGESMIEAGILDGDYVLVRPQATVDRGQIGAALVGGEEATVKKVSVSAEGVTLTPCNPGLTPKTYPHDEVQILGLVVGVVRKL